MDVRPENIKVRKVRMKWWQRKRTMVEFDVPVSPSGTLHVPITLPANASMTDTVDAMDDFMEMLYKAMREPIKDPDTPVYSIGHNWHTPPHVSIQNETP